MEMHKLSAIATASTQALQPSFYQIVDDKWSCPDDNQADNYIGSCALGHLPPPDVALAHHEHYAREHQKDYSNSRGYVLDKIVDSQNWRQYFIESLFVIL